MIEITMHEGQWWLSLTNEVWFINQGIIGRDNEVESFLKSEELPFNWSVQRDKDNEYEFTRYSILPLTKTFDTRILALDFIARAMTVKEKYGQKKLIEKDVEFYEFGKRKGGLDK